MTDLIIYVCMNIVRRVKCDEAKPFCNPCLSTGRKCDGYGQSPPPNTQKGAAAATLLPVLPIGSSPYDNNINISFPGTAQERRSFDVFRAKTAPQLSEFFSLLGERGGSSNGGDFWERQLLQAARHGEPSIRHAVLALGSLHAELLLTATTSAGVGTRQDSGGGGGDGDGSRWTGDDFSLKNYGQAISHLVGGALAVEAEAQAQAQAQKNRPTIDVCLVCCILFACIETMQSRYGPAITHIQSGLKILCGAKYNKDETRRYQHDACTASATPYVSMKTLEEMFESIDLRATQMVTSGRWQKRGMLPDIFRSLSKARESLVEHWNVGAFATSDIWDLRSSEVVVSLPLQLPLPLLISSPFLTPTPTTAHAPIVPHAGTASGTWQEKSASIMARWSSAYDVYLDIRGEHLTHEKRKGTAALRILRELGSTAMALTRTMVADDEMRWDVFCPVFRNIVCLAEDIIELDMESESRRPPHCVDMALAGPLFGVFCRCRDPIVRRKIIAILQRCGRVEGVWDAFCTAKVAQRILDIEEGSSQQQTGVGVVVRSCEDIPSWARLADVVSPPGFDPIEQRATLIYTRARGEFDLGRERVEEFVVW